MGQTKKVVVIGSGFAGLASACCLAKEGVDVTVVEKNDSLGGRARKFEEKGFVFDMGPSWYWMPEVFENFFERFGKKVSDYYHLNRLDPSYRVYFEDDFVDVPASMEDLYAFFEEHEPGSSKLLKKFLDEAEYKYRVGMDEFVWKPGHSIFEFVDIRVIKSLFKLQMFSSIDKQIRSLFKNPKLVKILEFPVLFLGAKPSDTPGLYSLMNYADLKLGTWYPDGGMHKVIEGMVSLAKELGVKFETNTNVTGVSIESGRVVSANSDQTSIPCDFLVASADYHHVDQKILPDGYRNYDEQYWDKRKMAPSSLLFYIGLDKKLDRIKHHNLFFDADFEVHATEIYTSPKWPTKPLFYVCCPSKTDDSVAPEGCENIFLLVPLAPNLEDSEEMREKYFNRICDRIFARTSMDIRSHIVYKRSYCMDDFKKDYNAYKGNAYGLANTLLQTAFLKPKLKNRHLDNLYYTGQLTTPGPGVPPSLISGQVVASEILKTIKS
ncbi:MAG: phytoene desaturase family protein [Saprospiraceae bacterium]|nr:phytoene desaturase family protein [Saprospiraceae bacterium]